MRSCLLPAAAIAPLLLAGCYHYKPRPLDTTGHAAVFLSRAVDGEEITALGARLRENPEHATFDLTDGVSLAEAEAVALVFNVELRLARARAGVTRALADNAGRWSDPALNVDVARLLQSVDHPWKLGGSLAFTLPLSGRLRAERAAAQAEHAAELLRIAGQEWTTRMELRRAWSAWTTAELQHQATMDFTSQLDAVIDTVAAMERVGEMSRNEARLFRIERSSRLAALAALSAQREQAAAALRQRMGLSPVAPITFVPDSPPRVADPVDPAPIIQTRNPAVALARARYEVAERDLAVEARRQYPDLEIGPGLGREEGIDEFRLAFSLPIPILNANRAAIVRAQAARDLASLEVDAAMESALVEAAAARAAIAAARERRRILEEEVAPMVDAQFADVRRLAELGEIQVFMLMEALTRRLDARLNLIEAARDEALATTRLLEVLGPENEP